jgi:hypothetical protein
VDAIARKTLRRIGDLAEAARGGAEAEVLAGA